MMGLGFGGEEAELDTGRGGGEVAQPSHAVVVAAVVVRNVHLRMG